MFISLCCMIGNTVSPHPRWGHESVVTNDNKLLVWGGQLFQDGRWKMSFRYECFTVDLHSQQWSQKIARIDSKQDEPTPCGGAGCVVIDSSVYTFGGWYSDEGNYVRELCSSK